MFLVSHFCKSLSLCFLLLFGAASSSWAMEDEKDIPPPYVNDIQPMKTLLQDMQQALSGGQQAVKFFLRSEGAALQAFVATQLRSNTSLSAQDESLLEQWNQWLCSSEANLYEKLDELQALQVILEDLIHPFEGFEVLPELVGHTGGVVAIQFSPNAKFSLRSAAIKR